MDQDRDPQKDIELIQQIVSRISRLTHTQDLYMGIF